MEFTVFNHFNGGVVVYRNRLTAIAGIDTKVEPTVEVLLTKGWSTTEIPPVGNKNGYLCCFTNLVIKDGLYIFGNIF